MKQLLTALLVIISILAIGQPTEKNFDLELGGPGLGISAIYDTRLTKSNKGFGFRGGIGAIFDQRTIGFALPFNMNYLLGKRKNFLELGAGMSFLHVELNNQDSWFNFEKENSLTPYGWIGYRYKPIEKGFTFRAGLCLLSGSYTHGIVGASSLYPGLSLGYSFK